MITAILMVLLDVENRFDLLCESVSETIIEKEGQPVTLPQKAPERLRIDLTGKGWCSDGCNSLLPLVVSEGHLTLTHLPFEGVVTSDNIDRRNGARLKSVNYDRGLAIHNTFYTCSVARFSGFPARKF